MSGLFLPLDVEYWHDEKIVEAGPNGIGDPLAELLYVRASTFCKRTSSDGRIKASQIDGFALRIPQAMKRWQYLVDSGAVLKVSDREYVIPAFLKRNKSAADIAADKADAKAASAKANHIRWHVAKGKFDPKCSLCRSDSDPGVESDRTPTEPEPEGEGESQVEEEEESLIGSTLQQQPESVPIDERFAAALDIHIGQAQAAGRCDNPIGLRNHIIATQGNDLADWLMIHPDATPMQAAVTVLGSQEERTHLRIVRPAACDNAECINGLIPDDPASDTPAWMRCPSCNSLDVAQ